MREAWNALKKCCLLGVEVQVFSLKKKIGFSINIGLNHYTVAILAQ